MSFKSYSFQHIGLRKILLNSKHKIISKRKFTEVKTISVNTCGPLYESWRKENKFKSIPKGDLNFKIKYVDYCKTFDNKLPKAPTIVALHGAPGSLEDFNDLAPYLHSKGTRVIVPSFPDFTAYAPGVFRHTAEEKAEFVKDFLSAISVQQVDVLIVHSSAVYPALILCLKNCPIAVKSLAMLCPGTHDITKLRALERLRALSLLVKCSESPLALKILPLIGTAMLRALRLPVRVENLWDPLLSATSMINADIPKSGEKFKQLSKQNFPMLYAFSDNDKLVGKDTSYDLAHLMGVSDSDFFIYDKEGNLKQNGEESSSIQVMSFENGSHYVFWKHKDIIKEAIVKFMQKHNVIDR